MSKRHDADFLARREAIVRQLEAATHAYGTVTDDHEQQLINTTEFRRAGSHEQGKSAVLELTLRCYPDGRIELVPHRHTADAPKNMSEMYGAAIAVPSVAGAVAQLCRRAIEKAQTFQAEHPSSVVEEKVARQ